MSDREGATGQLADGDQAPGSFSSRFAFPLIALLTAYIVFIGGGWAGIFLAQDRVISLVLITLVLIVWVGAALRRVDWRPKSEILPTFVIGILAMSAATLFSRQPRLGYDYLAYAVLLVALYLFLVKVLAHPFLRARFLDLVVMLAIVIGLAYVVQVVSTWVEWWGLVGRLAAPPLRPDFAGLNYGNPSGVMTMSVMLTLPALAHVGLRTRKRVCVTAVLLGLMAFCILASGSRAGWLGLAIALAIFVVAWLAVRDHRGQLVGLVRSTRARLFVSLVGLAGVVAVVIVSPGVVSRAAAGGETLRLGFYQAAAKMFADSPVIGTGPGTWVALRAAYTSDVGSDYYIPHAHDIYLQTLAELGIVGAIAGAVGVYFVGRLILRAIRGPDASRAAMGWATLLALGYFAAHQLLDFYASMPAALAAAAIPVAYLDATAPQQPTGARSDWFRGIPWATAMSLAALALLAVSVSWLALSESRARVHADAVALIEDRDWQGAQVPARAAALADPDMPAFQVTLGLAALNSSHPDEAAAAFRRAAEADDLPESWLGLATAQVDLGDAVGAGQSLKRAMRLGVVQPAVDLAVGQLYVELGDLERARSAYLNALVITPTLFGDPGLATFVRPAATADDLADAAIAHSPGEPAAVEVALEMGRRSQAETLAQSCGPADQAMFALVIPAWFGDEAAFRATEALAQSQPLNNSIQLWTAALASRFGNPGAAFRFQRIAVINETPSPRELGEVRLARSGDPGIGDGTSTQYYGHFTYRRTTPANMIPARFIGLKRV